MRLRKRSENWPLLFCRVLRAQSVDATRTSIRLPSIIQFKYIPETTFTVVQIYFLHSKLIFRGRRACVSMPMEYANWSATDNVFDTGICVVFDPSVVVTLSNPPYRPG